MHQKCGLALAPTTAVTAREQESARASSDRPRIRVQGGASMMRNRLLTVARGALLLIVAGGGEGVALDGKAVFAEQCASCHSTTGPAPASFEVVLKRKAPDLFYAGSKFNRDWLLQWIQSPSPIRRSGVMFLNHVVSEGGKDRIKEDTVRSCPSKLKADEAASVTEFLMALKDPKMRTGVVNREK